MFVSRFVAIFCVQVLALGCIPLSSRLSGINAQAQSQLFPDTSVNGISLRHEESVARLEKEVNVNFSESDSTGIPVLYLSNSSKEEYLALYRYHGDLVYQVSMFEVGYCNSLEMRSLQVLRDAHFLSSSGIRLGMHKDALLKIIGNDFSSIIHNKQEALKCTINSTDSPLLIRYTMPGYFCEYYLRDGVLYKYRFGFIYP